MKWNAYPRAKTRSISCIPLRVNYQLTKGPDNHCWQLSKDSLQFAQKARWVDAQEEDEKEIRKQDVRCGQMSVRSSRCNSFFQHSTRSCSTNSSVKSIDERYQGIIEVTWHNRYISSHSTTNYNIRTREIRPNSIMLYFHEWCEQFTLQGHKRNLCRHWETKVDWPEFQFNLTAEKQEYSMSF